MAASQFEALVGFSSQPTLVLSSSGLILAANNSSERLLASVTQSGVSTLSLANRYIFDLGITLLPGSKPVYRDLNELLSEASSRSRPDSGRMDGTIDSPGTNLWPSEERAPMDKETRRFWDNEARESSELEVNVYVTRKATSSNTADHQQARSAPSIRARLCVHSFDAQQQQFFKVTFSRPTADHLLYIHELRQRGIVERNLVEVDSKNLADSNILTKLNPHCTGILDTDGQIMYLTPSWYEFTGAPEVASLGTEWLQYVHPDDREAMSIEWARVLAAGSEAWTYEARYKMRDASYRWFLVRAQPLKDDQGRTVRWYASMLDVNEAMMEKLEVRRRKKSILQLFSQADVSLWGINQDHELHIREGTLSWIPPHKKAALSTSFTNSVPTDRPVRDAKVDCIIQDILDGKYATATLEHLVQDRWFRTKFVADIDSDVSDSGLKIVIKAVLGLTIDVTDVRARATLQIENERLATNERAAKESTRLKSQFLANMSHEIRTPISGIIGLAELLTESDLKAEQSELSQNIQQSAGFLLTLINDILDFSKIESGHMDIEAVPFRPSKLINDLRQLMDFQAKDRAITLICDNTLPHAISVIGDPGRLRQVLTNLLSNSIKFTKRGSVTLTVTEISKDSLSRTQATKDGGDHSVFSSNSNISLNGPEKDLILKFVVKDTGAGISKESMKKLFQPFSQADSSTARTHGGTGLGLSICRQLTELMGGSIDLVSEVGVGSAATVLIPYHRYVRPGARNDYPPHETPKKENEKALEDNKYPQISHTTNGAAKLSSHTGSMFVPKPHDVQKDDRHDQPMSWAERSSVHILVVEDNPVNQRIAMTNIQKLGFTASSVWNGQDALAYLDSAKNKDNVVPRIILMDCMMPVMDGYEATQVLRHDIVRFSDQLRKIPIIAMTASAIQGDRERCEEAGMDDYLTKPVNKSTLEKVIQKWIR